jgi:hypothetical protein
MSREYDPSSDYRNWGNLGGIVEFDGPGGERLRGEIVRVSSNPCYFHVEVNGTRYEVWSQHDNMEQVGGW